MKEIYKDIDGYNGKYRISNFGNVLSTNYRGNTKKPKVLTPIRHHLGYLLVHLVGEGNKVKIKMIHTLVAEAFIPKIDGKHYVNHIDGNKANNHVSNLEWVTPKENMNHAVRTGLRNPHKNNHPKSVDTPNHKPVLQYTRDGQLVKRWECISDAARYLGCRPSTICNNMSGRTKTYRGYVWRRPDQPF